MERMLQHYPSSPSWPNAGKDIYTHKYGYIATETQNY